MEEAMEKAEAFIRDKEAL
jgi:hypothetical protein